MFMSCHFPLKPRHVDGVLYVDFYGISTVNRARNRRSEGGHLERSGKSMKNTQEPYLARQLSVFSPRGGGSHQRVNLYACFPFPDGDARRHKDLSWFGQEKALRPAGEGSLYYLAPKCLYRGEYKCGVESDGVWRLYYVWVLCCVIPRVHSRVSPFIVSRRDLGYMYR